MSVSELARKAGVVDNTIRQLTLGNSEVPTFRVGLALAKALGIHPEELLHIPEEEPKETLVDRMGKLEATVERLASGEGVLSQDSGQSAEPVASVAAMESPEVEQPSVESPLADRLEKIEAVILKMLQAQGLHQKELEELRKVVSPAVSPRRAGKPPLQAVRAKRRV
jgi:transcriptional regulator with XRE-family HTH domain